MKKFSIVFLAVALALVSFAFTSKRFADGPSCTENLYYVEVSGGFTCNETKLSALQSHLTTITDLDVNSSLTPIDYNPIPASSQPYGCQDVTTIACALGYTTDQFELFTDAFGVQKFRVKSAEVRKWKCCVKKTS